MPNEGELYELRMGSRSRVCVHPRFAKVEARHLGACLALEVAHMTPGGLAVVSWVVAQAVEREEDPRQVLLFRPGA